MHAFVRILALAVFAAAGWPSAAGAAYQMMALIASNGAVPLTCSRGECAAEFSSFCLQPDRASPPRGAQYYAIGGEGVTIVATAADGRMLSMARTDGLRITALRGHNAVRISVPVATLRTLGLVAVAIEVGEGVSLVPEPIVGDSDPQTERDIAIATGPLRALGSQIVDHGGDATVAARLTNGFINALPESGRASPEVRDGLWKDLVRAQSRAAMTTGTEEAMRRGFEHCRAMSSGGSFITMRQCLGSMHDRFMGEPNNEFWDRLKLGS